MTARVLAYVDIVIRVPINGGWQTFRERVPANAAPQCYALPKVDGMPQCRADYWSRVADKDIPRGSGMIWWVEHLT